MGKKVTHRSRSRKQQKPYKKENLRKPENSDGNGPRTGGEKLPQGNAHHKQDAVQKVSLREDEVGITEFVSKTPGFTGVVKSRFSDFHVNEIDPNGKVLRLTDLEVPQLVEESFSAEEVSAARAELSEVVNAEMWEKITALSLAKSNDTHAQPIDIEVSNLDKNQRTQIHKVLKQLFVGKLVSSTVNEQADGKEQKIIRIMKPKGGRGENRTRWTFPGEYVYFLVHKENQDTSEVASALAMRLNLRPSQVNYCGTKDKRAKTTQKFCIKRRLPAQIVSAARSLYNVRVGNFEFGNEVLKLGDLKGNRFRIALRHISGEQEQIERSLEAVREHGFINYFGLQRFGNCAAIPTYEVGVALLKFDYKTACELILKPRANDLPFMRQIRKTWWKERNSAAAAAMFRNDKFIEKKLLDGLAQYGENDYAAALRKIPRNMLLLYPHALQSLIFNRVASRRIKEFGLTLMVGDLVYRNKDELDVDTEQIADATEIGDEVENEKTESESVKEVDNVTANASTESAFKLKVKTLTAEEVASGNYTLFDVVLPLPGYDITYPDNTVGAWYEEILAEYGLSSEKLRHNVKTFAMAGAYRKLLIQPVEMSWEFRRYDSPDCSLIASDWELLKANGGTVDTGKAATDGKFRALLLDFCLPTSVYATMLLRELLKTDTSAARQTQLEQCELQKMAEKESELEEVKSAQILSEKRKAADLGEAEKEVDQETPAEAKKARMDETTAVAAEE